MNDYSGREYPRGDNQQLANDWYQDVEHGWRPPAMIRFIHTIPYNLNHKLAGSNNMGYEQQMMTINIDKVEDVIDALNGVAAVAEMTSSSINAVYNWKASGKFPADTYLLIQNELKARGRIAPDHLWPMRRPATVKRKRIRAGT